MASSAEYVQFVCEQMRGAGEVTCRKMFGDYCLYCNGKVLGLVCEDVVYLKPTPTVQRRLPDAPRLPPYQGARPQVVLEELEDTDFLTQLIGDMWTELPFPKPKKAKRDAK